MGVRGRGGCRLQLIQNTQLLWEGYRYFLEKQKVNSFDFVHVHCTNVLSYLGNACQLCTELTQFSMLSWLNKHVKFGFQFSSGSNEKDCWKFNWSREIMQAVII